MKKLGRILFALICGAVLSSHTAHANERYAAIYSDNPTQSDFLEKKIKEIFPNEKVATVMIAIAGCESSGSPEGPIIHWQDDGALLPNSQGGQARGMFQVMSKLHAPDMKRRGLDINDLDDYLTFVKHLYDRNNGYNDWYESKYCWKQIQLAQK